MKDLALNPLDGYAAIYQNIEAESTANGFYKRVFEMIIAWLSAKKKLKKLVGVWTKRYRISLIGKSGIAIEEKEINYRQELNKIINDLKGQLVKILLLIDEVPEVLNKIK